MRLLLLFSFLAYASATSPLKIAWWGQDAGSYIGVLQQPLRAYCPYYDVINLSFLTGPGDSLNFANQGGTGDLSHVISDITYCQSLGVKLVLSVGGGDVSGDPLSDGAVQGWYNDIFGPNATVFAPARLDGIDFDIESVFPETTSAFQFFAEKFPDPDTFILTASPQCPFPDANVGDGLNAVASRLNYIQVQYYNNPACEITAPGTGFQDSVVQWNAAFPGKIIVGILGGFIGSGIPTAEQVTSQVVSGACDLLRGFSLWDASSLTFTGIYTAVTGALSNCGGVVETTPSTTTELLSITTSKTTTIPPTPTPRTTEPCACSSRHHHRTRTTTCG